MLAENNFFLIYVKKIHFFFNLIFGKKSALYRCSRVAPKTWETNLRTWGMLGIIAFTTAPKGSGIGTLIQFRSNTLQVQVTAFQCVNLLQSASNKLSGCKQYFEWNITIDEWAIITVNCSWSWFNQVIKISMHTKSKFAIQRNLLLWCWIMK